MIKKSPLRRFSGRKLPQALAFFIIPILLTTLVAGEFTRSSPEAANMRPINVQNSALHRTIVAKL
jgi:hypothetical protein